MLASLTFSEVAPWLAILFFAAVAAGAFMTSRGDTRYSLASDERDEYKARAERLAEDLRVAKAQIAELRQQPRVAVVADKLDDLLAAVDDLRESIDVHADPGLDRRARQVQGAPQRRLSDGEVVR